MDNGSTLVLTSAGLLHQSVKEYDRAIEWYRETAVEHQGCNVMFLVFSKHYKMSHLQLSATSIWHGAYGIHRLVTKNVHTIYFLR